MLLTHVDNTVTHKLKLHVFLDIKKIWQTPIFTRGIPLLLSAITSLTAVFGMGTGVPSYTFSPEIFHIIYILDYLFLRLLHTIP